MLLAQVLRYRAWLWSLKLEHARERMALEDYLLAVEQVGTRLATLDAQLKELARAVPRVGGLAALLSARENPCKLRLLS